MIFKSFWCVYGQIMFTHSGTKHPPTCRNVLENNLKIITEGTFQIVKLIKKFPIGVRNHKYTLLL